MPDQNLIRYWTNSNPIVLTYNPRSKSNLRLKWLKLNHLNLWYHIKIRSDSKLAWSWTLQCIMPDQNRIWYWTGSNSIVLACNARSKCDLIPNWLKLNQLDLECQMKTRSDIKLAQTQSLWLIMPDQNLINYPTGPNLNFSTYNATSKPDQILDWLEFNCFVL